MRSAKPTAISKKNNELCSQGSIPPIGGEKVHRVPPIAGPWEQDLNKNRKMKMTDLYPIMKGKAYRLAETIIAPKFQGEDLLKTIMSDSDDNRQPLFLIALQQHIPAEAHRRILLDGLAREYAGVDGWMAYVERETK
jgi:hypothetical protein